MPLGERESSSATKAPLQSYLGNLVALQTIAQQQQRLTHAGQEVAQALRTREPGLGEAEMLITGGLLAGGMKEGEVKKTNGSEARKVALAELVRVKTTASQEWIAKRLCMKSAQNVGQAIRRLRAGKIPCNWESPLPDIIACNTIVVFRKRHKPNK